MSHGDLLHHDTYRIEKVLGRGGFGVTYLATDLSLDRRVAIKEFMPKDYCSRSTTSHEMSIFTEDSKELVARLKAKFLKEARNIAKFDNDGIIKIHAAFEENNTAYYVMDFIEGSSLSEIVKREGPLSRERAVRYITQVATALNYIHDKKMNHLDVKPANIMVRRADDKPILIDFGLSKQYDVDGNQTSTTPTGISHGYAPMEQYNLGGIKDFSPQTDLYSLAATLYYLLSGVVPPQAPSLLDDELTFPETIPEDFIFPISKAMAPKRSDRHKSVDEFIAEINGKALPHAPKAKAKSVQSEETEIPVQAEQNTDDEEPAKPKKNRLYTIVTIIALAVIAIIVARLATQAYRDYKSHNEDIGSISEVPVTDTIAEDDIIIDSIAIVNHVENLTFEHPLLGTYTYTGDIDSDGMPDGQGVATWASGVARIYDGHWSHGKMDGEAEYTLRNGDIFSGTFSDDRYSYGRYTFSASGEYFEGSFRHGQPYTGKSYNSQGVFLEEINGKLQEPSSDKKKGK
jgi:serine/threonine protein kinase